MICITCQKEFKPDYSGQKRCKECSTPIKTCENCGKEYQAKRINQKYCSDCTGSRPKKEREVKTYEKVCVICEKPFTAKSDQAKYCPECQKIDYYNKQKMGVTEAQSDNQKMVKMRCEYCEEIFEVKWEYYRKGRKYCSKECRDSANRKNRVKNSERGYTPIDKKPVQEIRLTYEPHPGQVDFHNSLVRFRVLNCGNRWGKDRASLMEAIRLHAEMVSENRPDTLVPRVMGWLVAPTFPLARQLWRELKEFMPPEWVVKTNESERQMTTVMDGLIEVKSADDPDSLVAVGLDWVVITEAARINDMENVWANIRARLSSPHRGLRGKGGYAVLNSTPKGLNEFYRLYQYGLDPTMEDWKSWTYPTESNPYISKEEIESARRTMPERLFRQNYLAEFLTDGGEVFANVDKVCVGIRQEPEPNMTYRAAWDPARVGDFSGFSIRNDKGEQVFLERWTGIPWTRQLDKVEYLCKLYNYAPLDIDRTGVGDTLVEAAAQRGLDVTGHFFTNQFKELIVNNLSLLLEQKTIVLLEDENLKSELKAYTYNMTKTGKISYSHPPGGHDDMVDVTMLNFKDFTDTTFIMPYMGLLLGAKI